MYVAIKGSIKDIFDPALKSPALAALTDGIAKAVDARKEFSTKKEEQNTIVLTASASVSADDKAKPTKVTAAVSIDGVLLKGTGQAFKAAGNGTATGISAKKLAREVADLIDSVVDDLMTKKVVPQMLKLQP